jgi:hypothetical protein
MVILSHQAQAVIGFAKSPRQVRRILQERREGGRKKEKMTMNNPARFLALALTLCVALSGLALSPLIYGGASSLRAESPPVSARDSLLETLARYRQATLNRNVEAMVALLYPPMFEIMPREVLIKTLKTIYADDKAPIVKEIKWLDVGKVNSFSRGDFALVSYITIIEMRRPTDADESMDKAIIESFRQRMGPETKITIDKEKGLVTVEQKARLLAIREGAGGWKIIGKDSLPAMVKSGLLPAEIAERLGAEGEKKDARP